MTNVSNSSAVAPSKIIPPEEFDVYKNPLVIKLELPKLIFEPEAVSIVLVFNVFETSKLSLTFIIDESVDLISFPYISIVPNVLVAPVVVIEVTFISGANPIVNWSPVETTAVVSLLVPNTFNL